MANNKNARPDRGTFRTHGNGWFPKPNQLVCNQTGCCRNDSGHAHVEMANGPPKPFVNWMLCDSSALSPRARA
eukprot:308148-Lingulodinium_polyedra.AAC.1